MGQARARLSGGAREGRADDVAQRRLAHDQEGVRSPENTEQVTRMCALSRSKTEAGFFPRSVPCFEASRGGAGQLPLHREGPRPGHVAAGIEQGRGRLCPGGCHHVRQRSPNPG